MVVLHQYLARNLVAGNLSVPSFATKVHVRSEHFGPRKAAC
jgi:hypothetical protein